MHGFRPQRLISESSTNSSRETEGTKTQNRDENIKTDASTSTLGLKRNYNLEPRTAQSSHEDPRTQRDERKWRSCTCDHSLTRSEQNHCVIINEKEKPTVHAAIKTYDMQNVKHKTNECLPTACSCCSKVSNSVADMTDDGSDSLFHNKAIGSSRNSFCQHSDGKKDFQGNHQQQVKYTTTCHNPHPENEIELAECNSDETQRKYTYLVNNSEAETFDNVRSQAEHDASVNSSKANCDKNKSVLKERDDIINDYQLQEMMCHKAIKQKLDQDYSEIQKLRKNYSSLKKLFLALATLNIILILCVVSVMPVILVTFKLSGDNSDEDIKLISAKHLSSTEAKKVVTEHILCVDCHTIKEQWSDIFTRESGKDCCLEDVASLVDRVLGFNEKKLKDINSAVNRKIKHYTHGLENDISALETVVFNETFKPPNSTEGRAKHRRQNENLSRLVNTLLTRKRSAIHLSGTVRHHGLAWSQDFPKTTSGPLRHRNNAIHVVSGGVYFLYSCIRFDLGQCNRTGNVPVGYNIAVSHGGRNKTLADIRQPCKEGQYSETDLIIQKIVHVPVNDQGGGSTTLRVEIQPSQDLVSQSHSHSFGLFEI
ncbi:uncharacterized protein LOC123554184 isoform X2 [Mercenaria mercenaria]|uniref:uncharacterized protein LOC123554184 isoform X2 n=1 Tax=Mercenaria mercenaria TaxID=6596 RepID=UPI00234E47C9|nr:uncharacterized protein LOC123554184 isoform X2 [Mercenaria mercenaria]